MYLAYVIYMHIPYEGPVFIKLLAVFPAWFLSINDQCSSTNIVCAMIYTHLMICREVLGDGGQTEGHTFLHSTHCHPHAHQEGKRVGQEIRTFISQNSWLW